MRNDKFMRAYAAIHSGVVKSNILEAYLPFFSSIILENRISPIDENLLVQLFNQKYGVEISVLFTRQVLSLAVTKRCIVEDRGRFYPEFKSLAVYKINESIFDKTIQRLVAEFTIFCKDNGLAKSIDITEKLVLDIFDQYGHEDFFSDEQPFYNEAIESETKFAWFSFLKEIHLKNNELFEFVSAMWLSVAVKDALFFTDATGTDFHGLSIYLDTPMLFALLGLDTYQRKDACEYLVQQIIDVGCKIYVFQHNFQEFLGILNNAQTWALNASYDISKASKAAKFFHDSQMSEQEITEFIQETETKLNRMNITIKHSIYDMLEDKFQEDEQKLYDMINQRYTRTGRLLQNEIERSIRTDVRSIVMIYRMRGGNVSTTIPACCQLLLTTNNLIANVSKDYESNQSLNSGHIPACVSADFFGAIIWLHSPVSMLNYQKKRLLADCYLYVQPTHKMIEKYIDSLNKARTSGEIDDKKFLFLRSHPMVTEALMNVTKGDYARFSNDTWRDVYNDIQAQAERKYRDEAANHHAAKEQLTIYETAMGVLKEEKKELEERVNKIERERKEESDKRLEKKVNWWTVLTTTVIFGIPYIVLLTVIELLKAKYNQFTWGSFICTALLVVVPFSLAAVFSRCRMWCRKKIRARLSKSSTNTTELKRKTNTVEY